MRWHKDPKVHYDISLGHGHFISYVTSLIFTIEKIVLLLLLLSAFRLLLLICLSFFTVENFVFTKDTRVVSYRSGTVNSKSFVGKVLLRIKWMVWLERSKYQLSKTFFRLKIGWILRKVWVKMLRALTTYFGGARPTLYRVHFWPFWHE